MRFCLSVLLRGKKHQQGQDTAVTDKVLTVLETSKSTMTQKMNDVSQTAFYVKGLNKTDDC